MMSQRDIWVWYVQSFRTFDCYVFCGGEIDVRSVHWRAKLWKTLTSMELAGRACWLHHQSIQERSWSPPSFTAMRLKKSFEKLLVTSRWPLPLSVAKALSYYQDGFISAGMHQLWNSTRNHTNNRVCAWMHACCRPYKDSHVVSRRWLIKGHTVQQRACLFFHFFLLLLKNRPKREEMWYRPTSTIFVYTKHSARAHKYTQSWKFNCHLSYMAVLLLILIYLTVATWLLSCESHNVGIII